MLLRIGLPKRFNGFVDPLIPSVVKGIPRILGRTAQNQIGHPRETEEERHTPGRPNATKHAVV
jgi:hypothetical protein